MEIIIKFLGYTALCCLGLPLASCHDEAENGNIAPENPTQIELSAESRGIVEKGNYFALDLFETYASMTDGTFTISPFSVSTAMSMSANLNGIDVNAILKLLRADDYNLSDVNEYCRQLLTQLPTIDRTTTVNFSNSVWTANPKFLTRELEDVVKTNYLGEVVKEDPATAEGISKINKWVYNNTNGLIPKILESPISNDWVCVNTTYFLGKWKHKFDRSKTKPASFHNSDGSIVERDFMNITQHFGYYENENLEFVHLPYGSCNYMMTIMLPQNGKNLQDGLKNLNLSIDDLCKGSTYHEVHLSMPKFNIETNVDLNNVFNEMGLSSTESSLNLPNTCLHGAKIKVDENGTKAVAATVVGGETSPGPDGVVRMTLDREFGFIIHETTTGAILFVGRVSHL